MNITEAQKAAFVHKPKRLDQEIFFSPIHTKQLWNRVWDAAKSQEWWSDDAGIGCVGNHKGEFYFQITGLTSGFAKVSI